MGNWTGLHTLGLLAIGALVFFLFFLGIDSYNAPKRNRIQREKFDAIERSEMLHMTVSNIASATDSSHRSVIARLSRHKIKCKDFDGAISSEERAEKREIENLGKLSPKITCPHCQTKGQVHKKMFVESRRRVTQLNCTNCGTGWDI